MTAVPASITDGRDLVDSAMRAAVGRLEPRLGGVASYHLGWTDAEGRPEDAGGKALRPGLVLLSAQAARADVAQAVPGAVAVELVHAFSLLHDDIMDGDRFRRRRPAAWTVYGEAAAILAGDALLALAEELLLDQRTRQADWAARCLTAATRRLISGQSLDMAFETRETVGVEECLQMAGDKTGALLAASCAIGAILGEAPDGLASALTAYGDELGLAFQLADDLLGIWGDPAVTGKPVKNDLRSRKKSLPVVAALASGTPAAGRLRGLLARETELSEADLETASGLVEDAGGRAWAETEADLRVAAAARHLESADMPDPVREEFLGIARFVTSRDY